MNTFTRLVILLSYLFLSTGLHAETRVEITLVDKLDDARGYCIDIPGFQFEARPEDGLQIHTCYSYRGKLAVDQAFDADKISEGTFTVIEFGLCMTAKDPSTDKRLWLKSCDESSGQQFRHQSNGNIESLAYPGNCVTAGEGPSSKGGGGDPVHLYRELTLDNCDSSASERQNWRFRKSAD